jgi:hypothetical protein
MQKYESLLRRRHPWRLRFLKFLQILHRQQLDIQWLVELELTQEPP